MAELADRIAAFCRALREQHGFQLGIGEIQDAIRAVEIAGVADQVRFRSALRLVCCAKREQLRSFDEAFEAFFFPAPHRRRRAWPREGAGELSKMAELRAHQSNEERDAGSPSRVTSAIYSAAPGRAQSPGIPTDGIEESFANANALIAGLRLGRARRWRPQPHGSRFDLRRTLRASLHTGGDPAQIRTLGHPRRNPRIVLLIDASRSMASHAPRLLQFAYALCRTSSRCTAFVFSTELREITRDLRASGPRDCRLHELGESWGGGTRIGESLLAFLGNHGSRVTRETLVIVASDGLDTGEIVKMKRAMREIKRRCAGILWLNPHASEPDYRPEARGMRAALPYLDALLDASNLRELRAAARFVRR